PGFKVKNREGFASPSFRSRSFQFPNDNSRAANSQTTSFFPAKRSRPRARSLLKISRVANDASLFRRMQSIGRRNAKLRCSANPADSPQPIGSNEKIFEKLSPSRSTSASLVGRHSALPLTTCRIVTVSGGKNLSALSNLHIAAIYS